MKENITKRGRISNKSQNIVQKSQNLSKIPKEQTRSQKFASTIELFGAILMVHTWIYAFHNYEKLPDKIPIHYNISGEADDFGGKSYIFIFSFAGTFIYILFTTMTHSKKILEFGAKLSYNPLKLKISEKWINWMLRLAMINKQACMQYCSYITVYNAVNEVNTINILNIFIFVFIEVVIVAGTFILSALYP